MDEFEAADIAISEVVPTVVTRHRDVGILSWALLRQIESEVLAEIEASGMHRKRILNMLKASDLMGYPAGSDPVTLRGHEIVPPIFDEIVKVWNRVQ